MRRKKEIVANPTAKHYISEAIRAVVVAVIISLAAILLLALLIRLLNISTNAIPIINQVIKGVSILVACLICLRLPRNGWLRGLIVGIVYVLLAFVIFSLLNGAQFTFGLNVLNDIALGAVSGLISGIISNLVRSKKNK
ncbi:MAG: TIGR04086 family membrane protein [Firmicutes bacterium]|nr:TIGR04086 family membrane protein [Bacillota bacterium]